MSYSGLWSVFKSVSFNFLFFFVFRVWFYWVDSRLCLVFQFFFFFSDFMKREIMLLNQWEVRTSLLKDAYDVSNRTASSSFCCCECLCWCFVITHERWNLILICRGGAFFEGGKDFFWREVWLSECHGLPGKHVLSLKFDNFIMFAPFLFVLVLFNDVFYDFFFFGSLQLMARSLFWMGSFSLQRGMSVPTKRW